MNIIPKHILVPVDMSDQSARALRYASAWALATRARLSILLVEEYELPLYLSPEANAQVYAIMDSERRYARERVESFALTLVDPAVRPKFFVERGFVPDRILAAVRRLGADAIVMGTHGRSGLRRLLVGSVTEAVVQRSPVPVLTVRSVESEAGVGGHAPWKLERLLVPADARTGPVHPALGVAEKMARHFAASVTALECPGSWDTAELTVKEARASNADLVVIDRPGTLGPAVRILRFAPCPVLVVPAARRRAGARRVS